MTYMHTDEKSQALALADVLSEGAPENGLLNIRAWQPEDRHKAALVNAAHMARVSRLAARMLANYRPGDDVRADRLHIRGLREQRSRAASEAKQWRMIARELRFGGEP